MAAKTFKCLTCGGGLILNHQVSTLCRFCKGDHKDGLAIPLYCGNCCDRENKCANCGSPIRSSSKSPKA